MKVYGVGASPFVQRTLMAARLKGHELDLVPPPGGDARSPDFHAISPLGRIPVLDDDGWTLAESAAIVAYLDDALEGAALLPADPRMRARVRLIESLVDCELTGMRPVMTGCVFGMATPAELVEAGKAQVGNGLAAIERVREEDDRFAIGDVPTRADCALLPLLTLIEIADPSSGVLALLAPNPRLVEYRARMEGHPIIGRSVREMREGFAAIVARRQAQASTG